MPKQTMNYLQHYIAQLSGSPVVKAMLAAVVALGELLFPDKVQVSTGLTVLAVLICADAATGIAASLKESVKLTSRGFGRTVVKLLVYSSVLLVAGSASKVLTTDQELRKMLIGLVFTWCVGTESISILENAKRLGLPVPARLLKWLQWEQDQAEAKADTFIEHQQEASKDGKP